MKGFLAITYKDLLIEFKNRYSITSSLLFTLVSVTIVNFGVYQFRISNEIYIGLIWIIMFFACTTGISRSFISEEEKGTSLLLRLVTTPNNVFFGKLLFNILFTVLINLTTLALFLVFFDLIKIGSFFLFFLTLLTGGIGFASATTIIGAIVSRANAKGALLPVLAFPILIPILMIGIDASNLAVKGIETISILQNNLFIFAYSGLIVTLSVILFEFVWNE